MRKQSQLSLNYSTLQSALGVMGLGLPIILIFYSLLYESGLRPSLSDYYHTPVGDIFVGVVFMIGVILLVYRGYDLNPILANSPLFWHRIPDRWMSFVGGSGAILFALFPVRACNQIGITGFQVCNNVIHYIGASAFIGTTALFCLIMFPRGNGTEANIQTFRGYSVARFKPTPANLYFVGLGLIICICLITMGIDAWASANGRAIARVFADIRLFFWAEVVAIWAFSLAWLEQARSLFSPFGWCTER